VKAVQEASEASRQAKEKLEQSRYVASELERAATAFEQLSHSVNVAAEMADQARNKSTSIKDKSDRGTQTVKTAIAAMSDIRNSSNEIWNITKLIDEISFQTKRLGLECAGRGRARRRRRTWVCGGRRRGTAIDGALCQGGQ
jgi:methyl-accepting chemotaxis protein